MSLINDALKRASRAQPPPAPPAGPPMTPAEQRRPPQWSVLLVPVLLLGVMVVATWFFWSAAKRWPQAIAQTPPQRVAAREPVAPAESGTSLPFADALSRSAAVAQQVSSRQSAAESAFPAANLTGGAAALPPANSSNAGAAPPLTNPPPVTEPPKPAAPPLKLKAICYRPSNPSVLINTKTLFLGDKIGDARVIAIDQESVQLLSKGQTNVLTLE